MIPLSNHDFQWGRSEVVIIYPELCILLWVLIHGHHHPLFFDARPLGQRRSHLHVSATEHRLRLGQRSPQPSKGQRHLGNQGCVGDKQPKPIIFWMIYQPIIEFYPCLSREGRVLGFLTNDFKRRSNPKKMREPDKRWFPPMFGFMSRAH